ncbi:MAG: hypothetical protein JSS11_08925 [Verrucomicrobia bacterium]|nr:hypothetical protein [Verrucomicrobiota bacterium]
MNRKIRSNSFAARLTPAQRDELFTALAGGLAYREAGEKIRLWVKENVAAGLVRSRGTREYKLSEPMPIARWYHATAAERRYEVAKEAALVAQAHCPADYDEQARRALGQAKFLATLEGLRISDIAILEKNDIAREKLALEREKLEMNKREKRCEELREESRGFLQRARAGEKGGNLQHMIDLALEEIEKMQRGEA